MSGRTWKWALIAGLVGASAACGMDVATEESTGTSEQELFGLWPRTASVGLSLWFEDGAVRREDGSPKTLTLYGDAPRYVQELDITAKVDSTTDLGITPIMESGDMARLDWRGVQVVDEDWRPELGSNPRTYTRSRFYRKAKWMERQSVFLLTPVDDRGRPVGVPILELAGSDDKWRSSDDGFVRRFDARQITRGCRAIGDCTGATSFTAQALAQVRYAMHADQRALPIPANAKRLELFWSEDPRGRRSVPIERKALSTTPYRYGFNVGLEVLSQPANGRHFTPGEGIDFRISYLDGAGNRLHPQGTLPSYVDFMTDNIPSGIRYYDGFQEYLTLYYALKHREGNNMWSFSGPTDKVRNAQHVVSDFDFMFLSGAQVPTATIAEDGFTGFFDIFPSVPRTLDPVLSTQPNSDVLHVDIPADALPGTYVLTFKGRRDWGGEALNASTTVDVQVGQDAPSVFAPTTGRCETCHSGPTGFKNILHRNEDRRTCYGCHAPLESEPDHALDFRIHTIHTRSNRMPAGALDCSTCHLSPPTGPARGFPGIGPH